MVKVVNRQNSGLAGISVSVVSDRENVSSSIFTLIELRG